MDPFLIMSGENGRQQSLAAKQCWRIGRAPDNDIVVASESISRYHAMFQRVDLGSVYFVDLGSHNGSLLNGQRVVAPVRLADGDQLQLGRVKLQFRAPANPDRAAMVGAEAADGGVEPPRATEEIRDRLLVSVLVVDIRNSTVLARTLDEQIFSKVVGAFHTRAGQALRTNGSWGAKSTGDGQMAVWTHDDQSLSPTSLALSPRENEPGDRPVAAGLDPQLLKLFGATLAIADVVADLEREYALTAPLRIGAGVNTGFAMVGYIGKGDRPEYAAVGDTVNAAFRLESATKEAGSELMLGEYSHNRLFGLGVGSPSATLAQTSPFTRHSVRLKGYDTELTAYGCSFAQLRAFLESPPQFPS